VLIYDNTLVKAAIFLIRIAKGDFQPVNL